ncbi:MAG: Abi-alpha family protein [Formivibrio sp.]|nr:Abi-alpha family protein [Formivibrio sp.]
MDDPNQPIAGTFLQALDSGPVKNLLSPVTKHVGETLGYVGDIIRFYSYQNLAKIFVKWAEFERGGRELEEDEFRRVMPLLPLAAQVSDDDLQNRWATLLESAAKGDEEFLPSFGQTLSQLTAEEAKFLDRLFAVVTHPKNSFLSERNRGRVPLERELLIRVYDSSINTRVNPAERRVFKDSLTQEQWTNYEKLDKAELIIQDLDRLGIIVEQNSSGPDEYFEVPHMVGNYSLEGFGIVGKKIPLHSGRTAVKSTFSLSAYGLSFIRAVTPKKTT